MRKIVKKNLVSEISKDISINQKIVGEIVIALFDQIKKEYKNGNKIEIREFGTFYPYLRKPRNYQDPRTMKDVEMPEKTMLKFKCSKQLHQD